MNALIINAGSSSLKFHFYEMPSEKIICAGIAERIGKEGSSLHYHTGDNKNKEIKLAESIKDHAAALEKIIDVLKDLPEIDLIAHRVVHGGDKFSSAALITKEVENAIDKLSELAPLHNPVNLQCVRLMEKHFPDKKQVAVFDTSFHHNMPETAIRYAIPDRFYSEDKIRAYGFHGISHKYVSGEAAKFLQRPDAKLISIHLGNGCSIAAIRAGQSVDTSMGFGPLSGLVMATRSGDIDPSVILYLIDQKKMKAEEIDTMLNKESGLQALCGMTDLRDIYKAVQSGDQAAIFACELYAYRIKKYIGSYIAVLNGLDALIFTGGVGEHSAYIRQLVCSEMDQLGILPDKQLNEAEGTDPREISYKDAACRILVIPTNEELEIARQSFAHIQK
ncbi:MAG: acetate kinase [Citrobacter freundii]|nr:MAG: acetate kinase [Citrobacter freundii]